MKFFAIFALAAFFAVAAAAYPYEYAPEYASADAAYDAPAEVTRVERSYAGGLHAPEKACKSVLVSCAPIVQKVKCKGGY